MSQYTLDFSRPARTLRPGNSNRRPRQRMYQAFRRALLLLSGLVCGIALIALLRQRTETLSLRERYEAQTLQYDSLLTAKIEADRQLDLLRRQLLKYHHP